MNISSSNFLFYWTKGSVVRRLEPRPQSVTGFIFSGIVNFSSSPDLTVVRLGSSLKLCFLFMMVAELIIQLYDIRHGKRIDSVQHQIQSVEVCAIFEDMVLFTSEISRTYEEPNIFVAY